jgi:hypothetical protein
MAYATRTYIHAQNRDSLTVFSKPKYKGIEYEVYLKKPNTGATSGYRIKVDHTENSDTQNIFFEVEFLINDLAVNLKDILELGLNDKHYNTEKKDTNNHDIWACDIF